MNQNLLESIVHTVTHSGIVPPVQWVTESHVTSSAVASISFPHVSFQQLSTNICC